MAHDKTQVFISGVPHQMPGNCTGLTGLITMQSDLIFSYFSIIIIIILLTLQPSKNTKRNNELCQGSQ